MVWLRQWHDAPHRSPQQHLPRRQPRILHETFLCRDRLEHALFRIAEPDGEGAKACLTVYTEAARAAADAADARAAPACSLGPLDGVIVSIKDLFDVAGEPTRAGSKVLADEAAPATADAPVVRRLRAGGAVIVAKTNMTEFAFGAIGANPHFGTPGNPARPRARAGWVLLGRRGHGRRRHVRDRHRHRYRRLGAHSGGALRHRRLQAEPPAGADRWRVSLSTSLDSIGPLANSVADCAKAFVVMADAVMADAVMAGEDFAPLEPLPLAGLRFGIAQGFPLENLEETVAAASMRPPSGWRKPACGSPASRCRCSTKCGR